MHSAGPEHQIHGFVGRPGARTPYIFLVYTVGFFGYGFAYSIKANPNHVLRDEAARAAEEGRDYVSARGVDQALQVYSFCSI
jgi:hypothetical protein